MKITRTTYHSEFNSLECLHCGDQTELYRETGTNPHKLMEARENYEARHSSDAACKQFREAAQHEIEREPRTAVLDARSLAMHVMGF
jgi:hypothetical protein